MRSGRERKGLALLTVHAFGTKRLCLHFRTRFEPVQALCAQGICCELTGLGRPAYLLLSFLMYAACVSVRPVGYQHSQSVVAIVSLEALDAFINGTTRCVTVYTHTHTHTRLHSQTQLEVFVPLVNACVCVCVRVCVCSMGTDLWQFSTDGALTGCNGMVGML